MINAVTTQAMPPNLVLIGRPSLLDLRDAEYAAA
jgi:hypothetical protein